MKGPEMRADKSGKNQFKKYLGYLAKEYDLYPEKLYSLYWFIASPSKEMMAR